MRMSIQNVSTHKYVYMHNLDLVMETAPPVKKKPRGVAIIGPLLAASSLRPI